MSAIRPYLDPKQARTIDDLIEPQKAFLLIERTPGGGPQMQFPCIIVKLFQRGGVWFTQLSFVDPNRQAARTAFALYELSIVGVKGQWEEHRYLIIAD